MVPRPSDRVAIPHRRKVGRLRGDESFFKTPARGWPTNLVQIPNGPWMVGVDFFDHAALVDAAANAFGIVTTWSSKWTIGSGRGEPGAMVWATGNNAGNATGSRTNEAVVTLQLN